ncbi:MAG TPA: aminotransferase class I/II-fold pyridoxal phosphate-dependent enzyme [Acidimicrobiia bacterium]|nr:aminotransferase class I/II-fold pyridoxal phosphate-dependent enzyme [Acidimicrobiia bacterium]
MVSDRLAPFGVTIFSEMTALAQEYRAINLGQGFPNWDGAQFVKEAAARATTDGGHDQYPPSPGVLELRAAIAGRYGPLLGRDIDPAEEVTVTCGCTEALAASFLGLINPGDEVILIEPFYDAYPVDVALTGAVPKYVTLRPPDFAIDLEELASAFSPKTRAIVVNNPHNPTGRVFDIDELSAIASLCQEHDAIAITDEVYEEMVYGRPHVRLAALPGMWDRTLTLSSLGKTFSLTGWKVGWGIGPPALTAGLRAAHQFMTFTTPTPVQHGAIAALGAPDSFFDDLRSSYVRKRDLLASGLADRGFEVFLPHGTYFMMAGHGGFGFADDRSFCRHLAERARVVAIPPSVFYHRPEDGAALVRFAFCKDEGTLEEALDRMNVLRIA